MNYEPETHVADFMNFVLYAIRWIDENQVFTKKLRS